MLASRFGWCITLALLVTILGSVTAGAQETELRFWHGFTQPVRIEAIRAIADEFERAHPGVKVSIEVVPWTHMEEKWTSAFAAGTLPDVSIVLPDQALLMWMAGATRSVDDLVEKMGGRERFVSDDILDNFFNYDGQLIGLPFYAHARGLFYRADFFDEVGAQPPTTWEEYIKVAAKLSSPPDRYGMVQMWGKGDWGALVYLYLFMRSVNGEFWDAEGNVVFNSPENVAAVRQLAELYKVGSPPGELGLTLHGNVFDYFTSGRTAMAFETLFMVPTVRDTRPDLYESGAVGFHFPPYRDQYGWYAETIGLVKMKGKNEELADEFIAFLYEDDRYIDFLHTIPGGQMPVTRSVADSERFYQNPLIERYRAAVDIVLEGIAVGTLFGFEHGPNPNASLLKSGVIEEMFHRIVTENVPVEQAVADASAELERLIRRRR